MIPTPATPADQPLQQNNKLNYPDFITILQLIQYNKQQHQH